MTRDFFTDDQSTELPPLIEVSVKNRDFEPYDLQLLVQFNDGVIHSWRQYELPAATVLDDGRKRTQAVARRTDRLCPDEFLVSASLDGGDNWKQIDGQTYVEEWEDIPGNQGANPRGEISDAELTFNPRLINIPGQCSDETTT